MKKTLLFFVFFIFYAQSGFAADTKKSYMCPALYDAGRYQNIQKDAYRFLIPGKNDWVFRTQSDLKQDFKVNPTSKKNLKLLVQALKARGTNLILISVPSRGVVHGDQLDPSISIARGFNMAVARESYFNRTNILNEAGIPTIDFKDFENLRKPFFYKRDNHWTHDGAEAMAKAVANQLKQMPFYQEGQNINFKTYAKNAVDYNGNFDLIIKALCGQMPPAEQAQQLETIAENKTLSEQDLFGENKKPDIVLVGTSFSTPETSYSNFEGYLKQYLSRDILNKSITGGGFDSALLYYLTTENFRTHPPKILLWEFPSYYSLAENKRTNDLVRQALPAIFSDCGEKALKTSDKEITFPQTMLFNDVNFTDDSYYLSLTFSEPHHKNFKIISVRADGTKDEFKFKRGKRYPADAQYYLSFAETTSPYKTIFIEPPAKMMGLNITAKICKKP